MKSNKIIALAMVLILLISIILLSIYRDNRLDSDVVIDNDIEIIDEYNGTMIINSKVESVGEPYIFYGQLSNKTKMIEGYLVIFVNSNGSSNSNVTNETGYYFVVNTGFLNNDTYTVLVLDGLNIVYEANLFIEKDNNYAVRVDIEIK